MTLLLVHMKYTRCTLHITVDKEHRDIILIPRDFVFQTPIVSALIWFFSFLLSYLQFEFLSVLTYLLRLWVSQFAVLCTCLTADVPSPWTWTHIPVNMVIIRIYNCQTRTQLLNIVLCIRQSSSIFSCNQN